MIRTKEKSQKSLSVLIHELDDVFSEFVRVRDATAFSGLVYCFICDSCTDESIFNGLMSVVDTLAEIHSIDLSQKEEAKKLFVKC